jgi:hypothetical protein
MPIEKHSSLFLQCFATLGILEMFVAVAAVVVVLLFGEVELLDVASTPVVRPNTFPKPPKSKPIPQLLSLRRTRLQDGRDERTVRRREKEEKEKERFSNLTSNKDKHDSKKNSGINT